MSRNQTSWTRREYERGKHDRYARRESLVVALGGSHHHAAAPEVSGGGVDPALSLAYD